MGASITFRPQVYGVARHWEVPRAPYHPAHSKPWQTVPTKNSDVASRIQYHGWLTDKPSGKRMLDVKCCGCLDRAATIQCVSVVQPARTISRRRGITTDAMASIGPNGVTMPLTMKLARCPCNCLHPGADLPSKAQTGSIAGE